MLNADRTFEPPLTIGVLSDTHVTPRGARRVPTEVFTLFGRFGVGLILHAGDLNTLAVLEPLQEIAPVLAVHGNSDLPETWEALPDRIDFRVGPWKLALIHGDAGPTADKTARGLVGTVDCVIYGHSHVPRMVLLNQTILFNPGSPVDKRWWPDYSLGLLRVTEAAIDPELFVFKSAADLDRMNP